MQQERSRQYVLSSEEYAALCELIDPVKQDLVEDVAVVGGIHRPRRMLVRISTVLSHYLRGLDEGVDFHIDGEGVMWCSGDPHAQVPATTVVHPCFMENARRLFDRAGFDLDLFGPLAAWAQALRYGEDDSRRGVIVSEGGELLAETLYHPGDLERSGAAYVTEALIDLGDDERHVVRREVGLAMGALRRVTGRQVMHVKHGDVCTGAGTRHGTGRPA